MMTTQPNAISKDEAEAGKLFAILSYVVPLFFMVPIVQRQNSFATFHARQALALLFFAILLGVVAWIMPLSLLGLLSPIFLLSQLALIVIGVVHSAKGETRPLPLLGVYAEPLLRKVNV